MQTISPETEGLVRRHTPCGGFTNRVYLLLVVGGTVLMLLAVLGEMQPRLTCVAALWSASGLYGLSELLRPERRRALPDPEYFCADVTGDY